MKNTIFILFVLLGGACTPKAVFQEYQAIPEETWSRYQVIEFTASIPDSGQYNVKLCLRHTTDYEMANLWCFVSTRSSAMLPRKDTVNVEIAEPDGRWKGKGGTIKTLEQPLRHNPVTLPQGQVIFRIEQGMREEEMKGVKDIGIQITKTMNEER